ncbi:hypothetical protein GCM10027570_38230 [Streptomonospora sediminis]
MIGRWTVWIALFCGAVAGYLCFIAWRADGWAATTILWGIVCFVMLDTAFVFTRISRRRHRRRGAGRGSGDGAGGE